LTSLSVGGAITARASGAEGGQLELNNPDNASTGAILDVSGSDVTRWFTTRNNSLHQIGQLVGTGGTVTLYTAGSERMRIDSSGNVGIGNTAPAHTLSVTGTAAISTSLQVANITTGANTTAGTITGNWTLTTGSRMQATYADLAEKYVADATYEPGTVLAFGGEQEVTLANAFDSTKVAGVVTTNPAYSMNAALEAEHVAEIAH